MNSIPYDEDPVQAAEYLRLTFNMMGENNITPNPLNITLCYEYVSNCNPGLIKAMDEVLKGEGGYTNELGFELLDKFIWDDEKRLLENLRKQFSKLVGDTHSNIDKAQVAALLSAEKFDEHSKRFEAGPSMDEMQYILTDVVKETKQVAKNGHSLKQMLDETKSEVESLRKELEKTKREATIDPLTGLKNRRAFEVEMQQHLGSAGKLNDNLCLIMVDIDHFKKINDNYGHLFGDKVLKSVAAVLMSNLKGKDTVARIGGEEFAILLGDTKLKIAEIVAENLRYAVHTSRVMKADTGEMLEKVTVSMGVTVYQKGETSDKFMDRADKALYKSKRDGRNKVTSQIK